MKVSSLFAPKLQGFAHCDLPCGVYDPAQAKIEALSVKATMEKYAASSDPDFKARAVAIKEERSELVKHHLWVLWTDYFKALILRPTHNSMAYLMRLPSWPAQAGQKAPTTLQ